MEAASLESLVREHAPVRRGHFLLSSGMHTPYYVELEAIVQDPDLTVSVCRAITERFREQEPQAVLTALGLDAILGYEAARQLGARAIFADGPSGRRTLRPALQAKPGERVLILMGVIARGDSARELMRLAAAAGGRAVGAQEARVLFGVGGAARVRGVRGRGGDRPSTGGTCSGGRREHTPGRLGYTAGAESGNGIIILSGGPL